MRRALLLLAYCVWIAICEGDRPLVIVESLGGSDFECIQVGDCVACSLAEKQNDVVYHCSSTGYYMPYECVQVRNASASASAEIPASKRSTRKLLPDSRNIVKIYKSCSPPLQQDRLSVLGFEGIMLGLLAIFSPLLYYRKKRSLSVSGMMRIPSSSSSSRF